MILGVAATGVEDPPEDAGDAAGSGWEPSEPEVASGDDADPGAHDGSAQGAVARPAGSTRGPEGAFAVTRAALAGRRAGRRPSPNPVAYAANATKAIRTPPPTAIH